ncbi:DUF1648 domain-containing protein [Thermococcus aciditolerans]|uniref:DUF1648 domain-containing protein n=1 Tax=Thermococcus aciditolerans TaxID=2598455 RepID=UPI00143CC36F|nr:DUF1648 domain-containing protein [Thermococcus aciditolerans]
MGFYLLLQLVFLGAYLSLAAALWGKLPATIAVHFKSSGTPDIFLDKLWGVLGLPALVWLLPFVLTLLAKNSEFSLRMRIYPGKIKAWAELMTLMIAGVIVVMSTAVLYNARLTSGKAVSYAGVLLIAAVLMGIYRLITGGVDGRV